MLYFFLNIRLYNSLFNYWSVFFFVIQWVILSIILFFSLNKIFISFFYYILTIFWLIVQLLFGLNSLWKIGIYCICVLFYISVWTEWAFDIDLWFVCLFILLVQIFFYYILICAWVEGTILFWFIYWSSLWTIERYFFLKIFWIWAYVYGATWVILISCSLNHRSYFLFTTFWF